MRSLEHFLRILIIASLSVFFRLVDEEFRSSLMMSFISGQKLRGQFTVKPSGPGEEDPSCV